MKCQLSEAQEKCRLLEESLRAFAHESTESEAMVNKKQSGHSPASSLSGEIVILNGSSSNSTDSESSDFDEYFDTGEEKQSFIYFQCLHSHVSLSKQK